MRLRTLSATRPAAGTSVRLCVVLLLSLCSDAYAQSARAIADVAFRSVVLVTMEDAGGRPIATASGFFAREDLVVTNYHVVKDASRGHVKIVGENATYVIVGTVGVDQRNDLAILKVLGVKAPSMRLGSDSDARVGDRIYAVGSPLGLEGTFSDGIISGVRRTTSQRFLQITAPISPGSSGGPVLAENGLVIGIAVASLRGGQNLNFAIPVSELQPLLASIGTLSALPGVQPKVKTIPRGSDAKSKKVEVPVPRAPVEARTPRVPNEGLNRASSSSQEAMAKYRASLEPVLVLYERELKRQNELAAIRSELYEKGNLSKQDLDVGERARQKAEKDVQDIRRQLDETHRMMKEMDEISKAKEGQRSQGVR